MKKAEIKTKRLILRPMSDKEIETLMEKTDSDDLCAAYNEMLDECKRDPEHRIWYAPWKMMQKDTLESIGDISFKGPVKNHSVEIGYGIHPEYEGHGYMSEALKAITQWAFAQKNVVFVEAETTPDNKASQRILEKCGFLPDGTGEEGPRFVLESTLTNWSPIYMLFGMSIGMSSSTVIGHFQNQMIWGMAIGMSLGILVGMLVNHSEKKKRDALRLQRHPHA